MLKSALEVHILDFSPKNKYISWIIIRRKTLQNPIMLSRLMLSIKTNNIYGDLWHCGWQKTMKGVIIVPIIRPA